jgi:hypothetical protein
VEGSERRIFAIQSVAGTAADGAVGLLFPRLRVDGKAWWKWPPNRRIVMGVGVTRYMLDKGQDGQAHLSGVHGRERPVFRVLKQAKRTRREKK